MKRSNKSKTHNKTHEHSWYVNNLHDKSWEEKREYELNINFASYKQDTTRRHINKQEMQNIRKKNTMFNPHFYHVPQKPFVRVEIESDIYWMRMWDG